MKVSIVGAGPAGLYLGILLKKADPAHEIEIVERNAADATFGWGVVFSGETLGALRDADLSTYVEITDTFARWDTVDVRYRGELVRSRGNAFSGIARKQLLAILQRRAAALGVKLEFGVEVAEPGSVDADLVVAADGVNSRFRQHFADHFRPTVEPQGGKYVWFGTDLVLDAFRFIFTDTEHGLFQVHSYPFDERTSTFIVECAEPVWHSAGLDRMTEQESLDFCERLFAEDLAGHRLMSNKSVWLDFQRVTNRTWHVGNTVLIGDAAHTAHFSIGSGTKLAMEDAIALAKALVQHADPVDAAVAYELERQPMVERVQRAADESAAYFSRVVHSTTMEPLQFAANLLTRSGRVSYAGLTVRDPAFVQTLDASFARTAWDDAAGVASFAPAPLFAPFTVGGTSVGNRVVAAAGGLDLSAAAASGAGMATTPTVAVTADGRICPDDPVLDDGRSDAWHAVVDDAHHAGALAMIRLGHAGRRGATRPRDHGVDLPLRAGGWPLIAASALPYGPFSDVPATMGADDMNRIVAAFAEAAGRAADAGFDALELDAAHGYLLAGFLSPLSNRRDDEYGGSPENRLRFPLEVLAAVRDRWPDDRLLAVRLSVTDWARGGIEADDGVAIARALAGAGARLVHVEAGQTIVGGAPEYRRGYLSTLSDRVRNEAGVPTLVGGYLTTLDEVNTLVVAGRADLCVLELGEGTTDAGL